MSLFSTLSRAIHALYTTNDAWTSGVSSLLPEVLLVGAVPVPTQVVLASLFGGSINPIQNEAYALAFATNYVAGSGSVAELNQLLTVGGPDMTALVIPNVYRCSIQATSGGRAVDNVIGVRGTASGQEVAAANAVKAAWEAGSGPCKSRTTAYVMNQYQVTDLSSLTGGIAIVSSTTAGTQVAQLATNGACALIKWNGSNRSRTTRGRLYYGPLSESEINGDGRTVGGAYLSSFTTLFNAFKTSLVGAGFVPVVVSVKTSTATSITSISVEGTIATQRRRIRS